MREVCCDVAPLKLNSVPLYSLQLKSCFIREQSELTIYKHLLIYSKYREHVLQWAAVVWVQFRTRRREKKISRMFHTVKKVTSISKRLSGLVCEVSPQNRASGTSRLEQSCRILARQREHFDWGPDYNEQWCNQVTLIRETCAKFIHVQVKYVHFNTHKSINLGTLCCSVLTK